jgi:hypothetical protein
METTEYIELILYTCDSSLKVMANVTRKYNGERPLYNVDHFIQRKKRAVTNKPVYTEIHHKGFRKNEMAHLVSHPTVEHPKYYSIQFKDTYYNRNKNTDLDKLKRVGAHELAHIKVPHRHDAAFSKVAKKLGAGKYHVGHGVDRKMQ